MIYSIERINSSYTTWDLKKYTNFVVFAFRKSMRKLFLEFTTINDAYSQNFGPDLDLISVHSDF